MNIEKDGVFQKMVDLKPAGWIVPLNLGELWEYRDLILFLLWRDLRGRYRQMALGPLWMILGPLVNMVLFTIIFSKIAKLPSDGVPYPLFSYSALLPWALFSTTLGSTASSLLDNRHLIAKVYFPRLVVPIVAALSALVNFLVSFVILLGMMLFYGYVPSLQSLWVFVFLFLATLTGLAVGLWWASWIVHFRDLSNLLQYLIKGWMYATPVVYAASLIPDRWQLLYHLNPMANMIEGFRWALLGVGSPPGPMVAVSFCLVIPILISGAYYFRKTERTIVDIA